MNHFCPACRKPLLSGFSPRCNHCGAAIPAQLLFSAEKKAAIEAEEWRAKQALAAAEAARAKENEAKWQQVARGSQLLSPTLSLLTHRRSR
jgi:hypothetical protein